LLLVLYLYSQLILVLSPPPSFPKRFNSCIHPIISTYCEVSTSDELLLRLLIVSIQFSRYELFDTAISFAIPIF
ncbi:hypothetical protein, partial [Rickettsia tamurae]|uniref:hypothetical protein n=1 Tax=Rickettsia tamurae TaxID=334545 RepID=UPI001BFEB24F